MTRTNFVKPNLVKTNNTPEPGCTFGNLDSAVNYILASLGYNPEDKNTEQIRSSMYFMSVNSHLSAPVYKIQSKIDSTKSVECIFEEYKSNSDSTYGVFIHKIGPHEVNKNMRRR